MTKPTLVILPGWGGTKKNWEKFVEIAETCFDIQIIELPCFGDEPCLENIWGVEEYAKFAKQKISQYPNIPIFLLGHSFGGQVAAYLVAQNPKLIDKLILSGASIFRQKKTFKKVFFGAIAKVGKQIFKLPRLKKFDFVMKKILYRVAHSDYNETTGIHRDIFKKVIRQNFSDLLPKIKIPTLVIWGTKDTYVPLHDGKKIVELIPNAKLEIIKDGKHGLHLQQPENLLKIIKKFIEN